MDFTDRLEAQDYEREEPRDQAEFDLDELEGVVKRLKLYVLWLRQRLALKDERVTVLESSLKAIHIATHLINHDQLLSEENQARLNFILDESSLEPPDAIISPLPELPEHTKELIAFVDKINKSANPYRVITNDHTNHEA